MLHRSSTGAFAVVAALIVTIGVAQAADDAKYPNWKGQWNTFNPRLGGQAIKFDPTKAWGPAQQAPLTPEYQKVLADSMADQAKGGLGNYPTARCLPGGMPRMMASPVQEYIITPETTYIVAGIELRRIFTDGRTGRPTPSRPIKVIRSADGSTRTAMAVTTCSRSTPVARSRGPVPTMHQDCPCTSTISRRSRSASISTRIIRTSFMTRSPCSTTP